MSDTDATTTRAYRVGMLGVALVLAVAAAGFLLLQREDDEWIVQADSWEAVALSEDGRTLTFEMWDSGTCDEADRVELNGDLVPGTTVVATTYIRNQTKRDGEPVYCTLALAMKGITVTLELDEPLPDGVILVDGVSSSSDCATVTKQEVERGSTLPESDRIDPC